ncbi:hypothetical protein NA57DRAFT_70832 [Rhizodiscina lignyota]|uniref:Uncharacterized protein n=1 Tax=Rhizodiscina lignyota TaxID=1504668 RepID=A0A9P4MB09_9PEZI|nr:hypothetical protein NA57DRAFT_70832 [Rhizodiscina lignyota]
MQLPFSIISWVALFIAQSEASKTGHSASPEERPSFGSVLHHKTNHQQRHHGYAHGHHHNRPYYQPYYGSLGINSTSTVTTTGTVVVVITRTATATPASECSSDQPSTTFTFAPADATSIPNSSATLSSLTNSSALTVSSTLTFATLPPPSQTSSATSQISRSTSISVTLSVPQSTEPQTSLSSPTATFVIIGTSVVPISSANSGGVVIPGGQSISTGQGTTIPDATFSLESSSSIIVAGISAPPPGATGEDTTQTSTGLPFASAGTPTNENATLGSTAASAEPEEVSRAAAAATPYTIHRELMVLSWMLVSFRVLL